MKYVAELYKLTLEPSFPAFETSWWLTFKIRFFGASRQYIVNVNSIRKLVSFWNRKIKVVLTNFPEGEILVNRDWSKNLLQWLDQSS